MQKRNAVALSAVPDLAFHPVVVDGHCAIVQVARDAVYRQAVWLWFVGFSSAYPVAGLWFPARFRRGVLPRYCGHF